MRVDLTFGEIAGSHFDLHQHDAPIDQTTFDQRSANVFDAIMTQRNFDMGNNFGSDPGKNDATPPGTHNDGLFDPADDQDGLRGQTVSHGDPEKGNHMPEGFGNDGDQ